jgi:hypothetical protein
MTNFDTNLILDEVYDHAKHLSLQNDYLSEVGGIFFSDYCEDNNIDFEDTVHPYLLKKVMNKQEREFVQNLLDYYDVQLKNHVIQIYHPISINADSYYHAAAIELNNLNHYMHKMHNDDEFYSKYNVRDTGIRDILFLDGIYYLLYTSSEVKEVKLNTDFQLLEIKKSRV